MQWKNLKICAQLQQEEKTHSWKIQILSPWPIYLTANSLGIEKYPKNEKQICNMKKDHDMAKKDKNGV